MVDNVALLKDNTFFSSDFNIRYHFDILFKAPSFFDPYLMAGYGGYGYGEGSEKNIPFWKRLLKA